MARNKNKGTYNRKYYLHRQVKKAGCSLHLEETHKTIFLSQEDAKKLRNDKYLRELEQKHSYGIQITNPLWNE